MKKNVTVGLFTYHRPKYLRRQLSFFRELGMSLRVIVLDGSESDDMAGSAQRISAEFGVEYVREVSMQARHLLLNERLDTDYLSYAADDDLTCPSFYDAGERFLGENPEYSVVSGQLPTFHYIKKYGWLGYYFRNYLSNNYDFYLGDFVERIVRKDQVYALGCPLTFYGVRRSVTHATLCKYVAEIKQYTAIERLENIANCLHGGMKVLDTLMGFRDYASDAIRQEQRDDPVQYICDEDIVVLQKVIHTELRDEVSNVELLEYKASYAWPLPLRKIQGAEGGQENKYSLAIECLFNKYIMHLNAPCDARVGRALRNVQAKLFD